MRITSKIKSEELKKIQNIFSNLESDTKKLTAQASNDVAEKVKDFIGDYASKEYYIDSGVVKDAITIFKASGSKEASLLLRGRKFSLVRFNVASSKSQTLQAGVIRGNQKAIPRAFIINGKNGIPQVFFRKYSSSKLKDALEVLRAVSIPQMAGTERAIEKLDSFMKKEVDNELNKKINTMLRGGS